MQSNIKDTFSNVNAQYKRQHNTSCSYSYQHLFYSKFFRLVTLVIGTFLMASVLTDMNGGEYSNFFIKSKLVVEAFEMNDKVNRDVFDQRPEQGSSLKPFFNDFTLYTSENGKVYRSVGEKILGFSTYVKSRIMFQKHKEQNYFSTLGMDTFVSNVLDFKICEAGLFGSNTKTKALSNREKFISELINLKLDSNETELLHIDVLLNKFEDFVLLFNKMYRSLSEKAEKFEVFAYNCIKISNHNSKNLSYNMGINEFADLTSEEFKDLMLLSRLPSLSYSERKKFMFSMESESDDLVSSVYNWFAHDMAVEDTLPDYVDWIQKGCVSKIKNQGKCGSCWAFSASGAVEGAFCAKHHILPNLSEQQLVDCAQAEGNRGCNGGNVDRAFLYMIKEKGLCTEDEYPYRGTGEHCHAKKCEAQVTVKKFVDVPRNDVKSVMAALVYHSPVSVGVDANEWQFYKNGIFDEPCGTNLNHEVLIVGYGTTEDSDYWTIKNSWGESWGQKGYMQIRKNVKKKSGKCGILEVPVFPIVY